MKNIDIDEMVARVSGYFPPLTTEEQLIAVKIYQLVATGIPVTRQQLASSLQLSPDMISETLNHWWGVQYDATDRITGFWGLTQQPTAHRLHIKEQLLYSWCAWDALFVPLIIGVTVS